MSDGRRGQEGSVALLALVALLLASVLAAGVGRVGAAATARARAQAAADAVALAGAADGRAAAERIATANGAAVVAYRSDGADVLVTVERSTARATARARWEPGAIP